MPRRLDIELTSRTPDGGYTWRAAGAKQPRGTIGADLVPEGTAVGHVVRAEVESALDGLEVVAVLARQDKGDDRPGDRIEIVGGESRSTGVSVTYAPGGRRRREDGERSGRGAAREGGPRRPPTRRAPRESRTAARPEAAGTAGAAGASSGEAPARGPRRAPQPAGAPRERASSVRDRRDRPGTGRVGADMGGRSGLAQRRERRPTVSTAHRNALLATLGPQELPIAEQLLRGGIPAVRQALAEQRARGGAAHGASDANADAVLAIAEQLLPRVNLASWKDRATSAQTAGKDLRLRELRAVVAAARTVTLDEEARTLARALTESLDQRVGQLRAEWLGRITNALDHGRALDAVQATLRAPEPGTRLDAEIAVRLADAAGTAMSEETPTSEWQELLAAVVASPVRRTVRPRGIPDDPEAKEAARHAAGAVPELAKLLGLPIPPPPPPASRRPTPRRTIMAGGGGAPTGAR